MGVELLSALSGPQEQEWICPWQGEMPLQKERKEVVDTWNLSDWIQPFPLEKQLAPPSKPSPLHAMSVMYLNPKIQEFPKLIKQNQQNQHLKIDLLMAAIK